MSRRCYGRQSPYHKTCRQTSPHDNAEWCDVCRARESIDRAKRTDLVAKKLRELDERKVMLMSAGRQFGTLEEKGGAPTVAADAQAAVLRLVKGGKE